MGFRDMDSLPESFAGVENGFLVSARRDPGRRATVDEGEVMEL
jgi:hypothetical protein